MTEIELPSPPRTPSPNQFGMFEEFRNEMNRVLERFEGGLLPIAQLADISARLTVAMFSLINLALLRIKMRDDPNLEGQFRCPRWVPLAGFVCCLLFILFDFVVPAG